MAVVVAAAVRMAMVVVVTLASMGVAVIVPTVGVAVVEQLGLLRRMVVTAMGMSVVVASMSVSMSVSMRVAVGLARDSEYYGAKCVHENSGGTDTNEPAARDILAWRDDLGDRLQENVQAQGKKEGAIDERSEDLCARPAERHVVAHSSASGLPSESVCLINILKGPAARLNSMPCIACALTFEAQ